MTHPEMKICLQGAGI